MIWNMSIIQITIILQCKQLFYYVKKYKKDEYSLLYCVFVIIFEDFYNAVIVARSYSV